MNWSPHGGLRVKNVALYLTTVDQNGQEVCLNGKAVWNIFPCCSAADDLDGCDRPTLDSVPGHEGGERPPP
jgi:hypothetical protein